MGGVGNATTDNPVVPGVEGLPKVLYPRKAVKLLDADDAVGTTIAPAMETDLLSACFMIAVSMSLLVMI